MLKWQTHCFKTKQSQNKPKFISQSLKTVKSLFWINIKEWSWGKILSISKQKSPPCLPSIETKRIWSEIHRFALVKAARRAWAAIYKGFLRRRDVPVGGRDVPVGGRPTTRQADPTSFFCATGFSPKVAAPVLEGSGAFQAPSKVFLLKNSKGNAPLASKISKNLI